MFGARQRIVVLPQARREFREALRWYLRQNPQAAAGFDAIFAEALTILAEAPRRWAEVTPGVRRYLLPRYPYKLLYSIRREQVVVLSLLHHARNPDTWSRGR
jgi:plasmid stabilization system protein ParE